MDGGQETQQGRQLSDVQDKEVRDWVAKEARCGTVVRQQQIDWFAEQVLRRDSGQPEAVLDPASAMASSNDTQI
ncbi:hypothetical protein SCUCBS95973_000102 [Sporothrix curviconia]|uniref:Uncharacterized protein n=1 Tax=Sporothrix curviconia TaxID=1260050 RepID=A0ABP0ALH2_9PEZI